MMTLDATHSAAARPARAAARGAWLFGYGSLIHKVDFPFTERQPASVRGWSRRFWQGSHDHRGTPAHPGRVLTLLPEPDAVCLGVAYRIAPATFAQLDIRERNGYARRVVPIALASGETVEGTTYIAPVGNPAWLGPAGEADIARHIAGSAGPSGRNSDYVLRLAEALRDLGADDPHVFAIEAELRALLAAAAR